MAFSFLDVDVFRVLNPAGQSHYQPEIPGPATFVLVFNGILLAFRQLLVPAAATDHLRARLDAGLGFHRISFLFRSFVADSYLPIIMI